MSSVWPRFLSFNRKPTAGVRCRRWLRLKLLHRKPLHRRDLRRRGSEKTSAKSATNRNILCHAPRFSGRNHAHPEHRESVGMRKLILQAGGNGTFSADTIQARRASEWNGSALRLRIRLVSFATACSITTNDTNYANTEKTADGIAMQPSPLPSPAARVRRFRQRMEHGKGSDPCFVRVPTAAFVSFVYFVVPPAVHPSLSIVSVMK